MSGNVWEWTCAEWKNLGSKYCISKKRFLNDNVLRILRGGSWASGPRDLRSAYRKSYKPNYKAGNLGFRLAMDIR